MKKQKTEEQLKEQKDQKSDLDELIERRNLQNKVLKKMIDSIEKKDKQQ